MTNQNNPFQNKKAFITGSSRGIGKAIALELASQGCDILLHYNKNQDACKKTKNEIETLGKKAWLYQGNLCDLNSTQNMLNHIISEHNHLDIYVANAASTSFKSLNDISVHHIEKTFNLVVTSFLLTVQALTPLLKNRESQILTISGIDTVKYCPGHGLLAAAKSALETITKYLSVELASEKIHTKCLNPGLVATDSTKFYLGDAFHDICQRSNQTAPHGGFATPEEVAKIACKLITNDMNWLACQTVFTDGGLSFMLPGM